MDCENRSDRTGAKPWGSEGAEGARTIGASAGGAWAGGGRGGGQAVRFWTGFESRAGRLCGRSYVGLERNRGNKDDSGGFSRKSVRMELRCPEMRELRSRGAGGGWGWGEGPVLSTRESEIPSALPLAMPLDTQVWRAGQKPRLDWSVCRRRAQRVPMGGTEGSTWGNGWGHQCVALPDPGLPLPGLF